MRFTHFPAPLHGPQRDYTYYTEEPRITRVSRAMGYEPMPYQRYVWAVGTEYRRDSLGRKVYHYPDVLVSTPRQSGKTTLLRPVRVSRMIEHAGSKLFSTAQTQKHASKRMLDMVDAVDRSQLAPLFKPRRGKGDAGLRLLANGADLSQFTPNEEAIHGETPHYVDLDEIWNYSQEQGEGILGGVRPAMVTLHGQAQRWMTSTFGTHESTFMNDIVARALAGERPNLALFIWAMEPGLDPYDPRVWWTFHPALGNTITEEALRAETDMSAGDWKRAYCNQLTEQSDTFMPLEDWDLLAADFDTITPPPLSEVAIGLEVAPANESAALVAAWHLPNGQPIGRVLHQAPGTAWIRDYLDRLYDQGARRFAADGKGPVRRITEALPEDFPLESLGFGDRQLADAALIAAMRDDQTLIHDGTNPLKVCVSNVAVRTNNGVELFDRDKSSAPIPALIALSVALHAHSHPQVAAPTPLVIS